jgi:hypothetical protein
MKGGSKMIARPSKLTMAGLAIAGSLGLGATSASAQVYVDPYVAPYPVAVAPPPYVAPAPVIAPAPIVRERTVVVTHPAYLPPVYPAYRPAVVPPVGYAVADWW